MAAGERNVPIRMRCGFDSRIRTKVRIIIAAKVGRYICFKYIRGPAVLVSDTHVLKLLTFLPGVVLHTLVYN